MAFLLSFILRNEAVVPRLSNVRKPAIRNIGYHLLFPHLSLPSASSVRELSNPTSFDPVPWDVSEYLRRHRNLEVHHQCLQTRVVKEWATQVDGFSGFSTESG